mmetsp:Transcript_2459/g.3599  ORF Transcript_2459/g.3599 Transcript_2459/m.3599 type:complete len:287 (+) Transcript_2459:199-1059(+)
MASNQLIGSRISLISKKDIRYEGVLYMIDASNASVTLQNVKSWGTEKRVETNFIPPTDELFSCIVFRGCDIKDLHVHEDSIELKSSQKSLPERSPNQVRSTKEADKGASHHDDKNMSKSTSIKPEKYQPPHRNPNYKPSSTTHKKDDFVPGMGAHLKSLKTKGGGGITVEENEFDFQEGLNQFDKEALREEIVGNVSNADENDDVANSLQTVKKYNKSSFFDEISCEALDGRHRITNQVERTLNTETFGATSVAYNGNRRYGRGRGRGGYRGGYRRYNQNRTSTNT